VARTDANSVHLGNVQIDVRTPTYRRPVLLERALRSLIAQTYPHWRCVVLDDEPGGGQAREVCARLDDRRIVYHPNERNLGVGPNIDAAFTRDPLPGSTHACVLEDDNYYLPDLFQANLAMMNQHSVDIVIRNSIIELPWKDNADDAEEPQTMYQGQYKEGVITKEELWGVLFYSIGASNLGLFWRLERGLCFSTMKLTDNPVLQERLRTLRIDRPVYMAMEPKAVWRDNGPETTKPISPGFSWYLTQIRWACAERELYLKLYEYLRKRGALQHVWDSRLRQIDAHCERVFRRVGIRPPMPSQFSLRERAVLGLKREIARVLGKLVADPIRYRIGDHRIEEA
jgi:glycosyltransferase involved in cell wall biosynthesis